MISLPKRIELRSESGSRWALGLSSDPNPRLNETQAKMSAHKETFSHIVKSVFGMQFARDIHQLIRQKEHTPPLMLNHTKQMQILGIPLFRTRPDPNHPLVGAHTLRQRHALLRRPLTNGQPLCLHIEQILVPHLQRQRRQVQVHFGVVGRDHREHRLAALRLREEAGGKPRRIDLH